MAAFRDDPEEWQRLDWQILQNGPVSLYHSPAVLADDLGWLRSHGYKLDEIACAHLSSEGEFHEVAAQALAFPDYYGQNLNSLNDCLSDLDVPPNGGRALVLQRYDAFSRYEPGVAQQILGILAVNSRRFLLTGRRLIVLVQSDDPNVQFTAVGACSVTWNAREWLGSTRLSRPAS